MSENVEQGPNRWLRWLGWGFGILILLLFVAHAIWTSMMASRFNAAIEALQRAGEPIVLADFAVVGANSPDNAGPDILAASSLLSTNTPDWAEYDKLELLLPLRDGEKALFGRLAAANAAAIQRLEPARSKTRLDWDLESTDFVKVVEVMGRNDLYRLGNALAIQAVVDHERGDDRAAMDRIGQLRFIARFADRHPLLSGYLPGTSLEGMANASTLQMAPDLRIGSGATSISPEELKRIITQLLDDSAAKETLIRSVRGQRIFQVEMLQMAASGTALPQGWAPNLHPLARYFMRPLYFRGGPNAISIMSRTLVAAQENSWPAMKAKLPEDFLPRTPLDQLTDFRPGIPQRYFQIHFQSLAERRMTAIALAGRGYAIDHGGNLPEKLEDLVPTYLPAIPMDPFDAGGGPLRYKSSPDAPVVYSVGSNGVDDGGSDELPKAFKPYVGRPIDPWVRLDRVQPLYRVPRPPPPATNPAGE